MKVLLSLLVTFSAVFAVANEFEFNSAEMEDLKQTELLLFDGQGLETIQSLTASGNYYCKKKNNKWVRCSKVTGQCFGEPMDKKFQCMNAISSVQSLQKDDNGKTCKKGKGDYYVKCDKSTGQCYGKYDELSQCQNSSNTYANPEFPGMTCKKQKNNKYQICNNNGCFGNHFDTKAQCDNTI